MTFFQSLSAKPRDLMFHHHKCHIYRASLSDVLQNYSDFQSWSLKSKGGATVTKLLGWEALRLWTDSLPWRSWQIFLKVWLFSKKLFVPSFTWQQRSRLSMHLYLIHSINHPQAFLQHIKNHQLRNCRSAIPTELTSCISFGFVTNN